jgi:hypothetical protein
MKLDYDNFPGTSTTSIFTLLHPSINIPSRTVKYLPYPGININDELY